MLKIHYYQKNILKKLTLNPELNFNKLIVEGLESEHMNYHLKQLVSAELVEKIEGMYRLTDKGKDYTNLLDDNIEIEEKQPKSSVIIWGIRKNKGKLEYLVARRLRHPYYKKVGRLSGKIRFGETLEEAAKRELYEETGLTAKYYKLEEVYHKIRMRDKGEVIQDVLFYIFFIKDFKGLFIKKTEHQENFWVSEDDYINRKKLGIDFYDDFVFENRSTPNKTIKFVESYAVAEGF